MPAKQNSSYIWQVSFLQGSLGLHRRCTVGVGEGANYASSLQDRGRLSHLFVSRRWIGWGLMRVAYAIHPGDVGRQGQLPNLDFEYFKPCLCCKYSTEAKLQRTRVSLILD